MNSKKCLDCGLVNFLEADFCRRCGKAIAQTVGNLNLFACPDCANSCSKNANNCPHCGRVLNSAPVYVTQAPKKTSPFTWFILAVVCVFPVLCFFSVIVSERNKATSVAPVASTSEKVSSDPAAEKLRQSRNPETRRKFAFGLEASIDTSKAVIKNTRITTEGSDDDTLVIKADGIGAKDCQQIGYGDYGKTASAIGFIKLTCRNRVSDGEWSIYLPKTNL